MVMRWIRRPPLTPASDGDRDLFLSVLGDAKFQFLLRITPAELAWVRRDLTDPPPEGVAFRRSPFWQLGYAGLDKDDRSPVLALPRGWPAFVRRAIAAHELVHYLRHRRGVTPFRPWHDDYGPDRVCREECVAWLKSSGYSPVGTAVIPVLAVAIIGALALTAYEFSSWVFG